jgi:F-type H+-transporting ATPase subunit gamma
MASLRDIRKRIRSVKSTQKITRAMKLVSASKLRRAQQAIVAARPYAVAMHDMISRIAQKSEQDSLHPLLDKRPEQKKVMVVVLTSDRGMCGAFNSNAIKKANNYIKELKAGWDATGGLKASPPAQAELASAEACSVELGSVGRRGRDFFKKRGFTIRREYSNIYDGLNFAVAQKIANEIRDEYLNKDLDAVYFVYNEFKSAVSQQVVVEQLLPIQPATDDAGGSDYEYEPTPGAVLDELLPRYLATQVYRALLESQASEHGARMSAMENATKNASEMIASLTLVYNRARQAAITKELMEIISGSEAQKG